MKHKYKIGYTFAINIDNFCGIFEIREVNTKTNEYLLVGISDNTTGEKFPISFDELEGFINIQNMSVVSPDGKIIEDENYNTNIKCIYERQL